MDLKTRLLFGFLGFILAGFGLKLFYNKVEEDTQSTYQKTQDLLVNRSFKTIKTNLEYLDSIKCNGISLSVYFQQKLREYGLPDTAVVIIPAESSGNPYATGCDPCGGSQDRARKSRPWLDVVFRQTDIGRRKCKIFPVCSIGFGLTQITSHTIEDYKNKFHLNPYSLVNSKWKEFEVADPSHKAQILSLEPQDSPYNVCKNIDYGLMILRDKLEECVKKKAKNKVKNEIACAFCAYNGSSKYLQYLRQTAQQNFSLSLFTRLGFVKDSILEKLKDFIDRVRGIPPGEKCYSL